MIPLVLRLALKNLRRNRRRTALTGVAIVAGIGCYILGQAFVDGTRENIIVSAEEGLVGHLTARPRGYPAQGFQHPVDQLLAPDAGARAFLDRSASAWTGRLLFSPILAAGRDSLRVRGIGYDPQRDERVFPRGLWQVAGALPDPARDEVLLGRLAARLLGLKPGDRVVLQARTHPGAINALELRVSGVLRANNTALDGLTVLLPLPLAQRLLATDQPSHVSLRLGRREQAEALRQPLQQALGPQAEVVTWEDETRDLLRLQEIRRKALDGIVLVLLALAGLGMANTILMAAHERVREIGMLRSMGLTAGGVLGLFLCEGVLLGLAGSALGVAWGGGLSLWWSKHPLDFSQAMEGRTAGDLALSSLIYTQVDPAVVAWALGFGLAISIAASLYPARVAARLSPADAVRAA